MDRLLSIIAAFSIVLIGVVLFNIRRAHIRVEYSVSWLGAAIILLILSQSPWILGQLAHFIGLNNLPVSLLLIVGALFLVVFFRFSVIMSDLKDSNVALTQKVAILEYQINALHEKPQSSRRE